jgi:lauroyl/myristoyl acyltransferase
VNRLRAKGGHDITPLSPAALRKALRRLNEGGIVAIGMDYPTPTEPERPKLFGAPSYFPAGPARFALLSEATVFVVACHYDQTEGYKLYVTGPVEMEKTEDRKKSAEVNTRRLARIAEDYIRRCPEQWMMFYPFWPDVADGKKAEEAPP